MKLLVLGADGQLGTELKSSLSSLGQVIALGRKGYNSLCGDLTDFDGLSKTIRSVSPDVIVNAAAYTNVDRAESEPDIAFTVNGDAPGVIANEARKCGALLVHYSTDYVFDGSGDRAWRETDPTGPLNVYGASKLQGEHAIREASSHYLILRTSWVFAATGRNFVRTLFRLAETRTTLNIVDDQFGAPTGAKLIANTTLKILSGISGASALAAVYHLAATGETTWFHYAQYMIERLQTLGSDLSLRADCIRPVSSEEFGAIAERPRNSRLDSNALQNAFNVSLPDWRLGVDEVLKDIRTQRSTWEST